MEARRFFIGENENIFERLEYENVDLNRKSRINILSISKKSNNNHIGYYQFRAGEEYYKIFVIPKILKDLELSEQEMQNRFVGFLQQYYRLKIRHGEKVSTKPISGNITDLTLDTEQLQSMNNVEDFLYLKYLDALLTVRNFFKKHKRQEYISKGYSSQSVRHKIDLNANIRSLDKSIVHQIKKEPVSYSVLAAIALSVLKQFKRKKIAAIDISSNTGEQIVSLAVSNENILKKRFLFDKSFSITMRELTTHKTIKLFSKNLERKNLYQALLVLAGMEYFGDGDDKGTVNRIDSTVSIFFNPSDLYEWFVYDKLLESYHVVHKDGLDATCQKNYNLYKNGQIKAVKSSEPDFIISDETGESVVVDAKWKVPNSYIQIHYEDVAKLKRDCLLRGCKKAILIYPLLPPDSDGNWYFEDDVNFQFQLKQYEF